MVRLTMDRERMKYLFREILGVDVDDVVRKVVATIAVERAKQVQQNTKDWKSRRSPWSARSRCSRTRKTGSGTWKPRAGS